MQIGRRPNEFPLRRVKLIRRCETHEEYVSNDRERRLAEAFKVSHNTYEKVMSLQLKARLMITKGLALGSDTIGKAVDIYEKPIEVEIVYHDYPRYSMRYKREELEKLLEENKDMENRFIKEGDVCSNQGKTEETVSKNPIDAARAYSLSAMYYLKGLCKLKCPDIDDKQLIECDNMEQTMNILQKHGIDVNNEKIKQIAKLFALYVVPVPSATLNVAKDLLVIKESVEFIKGMIAESNGEEDVHSKAEEIRKQLPEVISGMYTDEEIIELYKEAGSINL